MNLVKLIRYRKMRLGSTICLLFIVWSLIVFADCRNNRENNDKYCDNESQQLNDMINVNGVNTSLFSYTFAYLNRSVLCIEDSEVYFIQDGSLCPTSSPFQKIVLYHNKKFPNLSKRYFGVCPTLKTLKLYGNKMRLEKDTFSQFYDLRELILQQQNIIRITPQYFHDLYSLENLEIINCNVEEIDAGAFDNLQNLKSLRIEGNYINRIDGLLVHLGRLVNLTILEKLSHFPWDDLRYLQNLEILNIGYSINGYDVEKIIHYTPNLKKISLPRYELCSKTDEIKRKLRMKNRYIQFDTLSCINKSESSPQNFVYPSLVLTLWVILKVL